MPVISLLRRDIIIWYLIIEITNLTNHLFTPSLKSNQIQLESITTDLVNGLLPRLYHSIDILCFNPPYVVTTSEDLHSSKSIEKAWAGGIDGREVIDRVLPLVDVKYSSFYYWLNLSDIIFKMVRYYRNYYQIKVYFISY